MWDILLRFMSFIFLSLFLIGCTTVGHRVMEASYMDYSNAYASANNHEMLLNLARIRNGHPPYFLQLGDVTASFQFNKGITGTRYSPEFPTAGFTDAITPSFSMNESPTFKFTPLSGEHFSSAILKPISHNTFFAMSGHSYPMDMLMRIMLDHIIFDYGENQPKLTWHNYISSENLENYGNFLRLSAIMDELNKKRLLEVVKNNENQMTFKITKKTMKAFNNILYSNPTYHFSGIENIKSTYIPTIKIYTRPFMSMLLSVAWEEENFLRLKRKNSEFLERLPERVRRPILQINSNPEFKEKATANINYAGKDYLVSDKPNEYYNRQAFALMQFMASQIALNPDQLPTSHLLQLQ